MHAHKRKEGTWEAWNVSENSSVILTKDHLSAKPEKAPPSFYPEKIGRDAVPSLSVGSQYTVTQERKPPPSIRQTKKRRIPAMRRRQTSKEEGSYLVAEGEASVRGTCASSLRRSFAHSKRGLCSSAFFFSAPL